ncbi:hypothetical protein NLI96_g5169 [Meripilus lineatus]|uniref:MYND-type domain-containing protein n=1 Tax=Meripilus lineatus TaxID=2056292 RepID=A0AAD5V388_9APHY|nr:hypothetical protein NLI96_g5169 [Physisporinus lineatus]
MVEDSGDFLRVPKVMRVPRPLGTLSESRHNYSNSGTIPFVFNLNHDHSPISVVVVDMDASGSNLDVPIFNPACPCCREELGLGNSPLPKPTIGKHRHPVSDPNESLRNKLTQCQNCWVSKGPGVTFSRCGACKIDIYCSKECQKKAWPSHKEKCKLNQRILINDDNPLKYIQKFTSKHRPVLAESAVRALELSIDIERPLRYVLAVFLRKREDSQRAETSYFVTGADVLPYEAFPSARCEEMKDQIRKVTKEYKKSGMDGALFVVLMCPEEGTMNIAPVGFSRNTFFPPGTPWKEFLFAHLNEGVVN